MNSVSKKAGVRLGLIAATAVAGLVLAGCAGGGGDTGGDGDNIILVGTTDKVTTLDPAGSYDNGSLGVQTQVFPYLVNTDYNSTDVVPDLAETAEFTAPNEYTVTLPEGLKWANGNDLTSSDVKFSFDRNIAIADPNGASSLLYNLDSVETPDDLTVVFKLKTENDQIFPQILTSFPGAIVDEESFSADAITPDEDIVEANAFGGPYIITSYEFNQTVEYAPNPEYKGLLDAPVNDGVITTVYADSSNLKLAVQEGEVDVAYRSLSPTDIADLSTNDAVTVHDGPGGEIRYIVFNFNTMPFGATTPEADPAKAHAVRQAVASLVDRQAIATQVYKDTYTPLYSFVPDGFAGATTVLKDLYGDGDGGPDADKAAADPRGSGCHHPGGAEPAVQLGRPLRPLVGRRVRDGQGPAGGGRPVHRRPAVHRVGSVLEGPHRRRVPGLPARLVPGLLGRGQLPDAVLPDEQLPREPLQRRRGGSDDPDSRRSRPTRPSAAEDRRHPGPHG